jgi:tetratricopeptide (TPR) repeat protein
MSMNPRQGVQATAIMLIFTSLATAQSQVTRLLEDAAITERADHVDLALEFGCTLRYQAHSPAAEGDELRVKLVAGPDCGLTPTAQFPVERLLPPAARGLVRVIELSPGISGGADLVIRWNRVEKFVLAPAGGMRGMRVRVARRGGSQVSAGEPEAGTGRFAINLASARQPFDPIAIGAASAQLQVPVYVSEAIVDGERWHRLRAGPFESRRIADEVLRKALGRYPSAWMGIDDETTMPAPAPAPVATSRKPETRADPVLDAELEAARANMALRQHDEAIARLTRIVAADDYVRRIQAAELLGLARERRGQLAQAKATYDDFLRRYPDSKAAARIRERYAALRAADLPGRRAGGRGDGRTGWSGFGNVSQIYRRDNADLSATGLSRRLTTQNALLTDMDGVVRHRGQRYDFTARTSFGYMKDLMPTGRENRLRVSSAYVELNDREAGVTGRLGRQSRGMAGVNGPFDGALATWLTTPRFGASLAFGLPVESTRESPDTHRMFLGVSADMQLPAHHFEGSLFVLGQQYDGHADRRSVGMEARYLRPGRTILGMLDYDVAFGELNHAMLFGTLITDSRWTFNLEASLQSSPQLSLRNALLGQPTLAFADLFTTFTLAEIEELALDRSARLTQLSALASHAFGDRIQWTISLLSMDLTGTPASGGVAEVLAPGRDNALTSELIVNSLFRAGDTLSLAARAQQGDSGDLWSLGLGNRLPLGGGFQLTTRVRADHRRLPGDNSTQWIWSPSLRLEYARSAASFELEAGVELARRNGVLGSESMARRYFSAGYRIFVDRRPR